MQKLLNSKIFIILVLIVLFLIGFSFIRGIVYERKTNYQQVISAISRDHVQSQTVLMPFIVVPIKTSEVCSNKTNNLCEYQQQIVVLPKSGTWQNKTIVDNQSYKRGIYRAISYQNKINLQGRFELPTELLTPKSNQQINWSEANIRFYLSDMRGLKNQPVLRYQQQKLSFSFPKQEGFNPLAMSYSQLLLPDLVKTPQFDFSFEVDMTGTSSIQMLPLGQDLAISLQANWPDASFFGESLPTKQLNKKDFKADWQNTFLNNRNGQTLSSCFLSTQESCQQLQRVFIQINQIKTCI